MNAFILAAGLGTRLKPLTDSMPKALVPLNGVPLLQLQLEKFKAAGIHDVVVNIHHFGDQIIDFLHANNNFGMNILISDEREQLLETGGGLRKAVSLFRQLPNPDAPVLVHNVDILSNLDFSVLAQHSSSESLATLVVSERQTQRYLVWNATDELVGWTNIQTAETKGSNQGKLLAFSGIQLIQPSLFPLLEAWPEERFSIVNFYLAMMGQHRIKAYVPQNYQMMDVGKISVLRDAEIFASSLTNQ